MKRVLVLIDVMLFYDREVFKGIKSSFHSYNENVEIHVNSVSYLDRLKNKRWDIVIADANKLDSLEVVSKLAKRCLVYSSHILSDAPDNVITLTVKNEQFSELALAKFIDLNIRKVSFYENECNRDFKWSQERREAFNTKAKMMGFEVIDPVCPGALRGAEKVGVLCDTDNSARILIQKLANENIVVPNQVSVIGIDCDPIENEISPISITSIDINPFEIGKMAVTAVMAYVPQKRLFYVPSRLEENLSCGSQVESDGLVNKALYFICNNYQNRIKVDDVAQYCRVSRRTLDNRFYKSKNSSVHQYITDQRIARCKKLLKESNQSIEDIALQCGYTHQSYLHQVFRKSMSCTPLEYRKEQFQ